MGLELVGNLLQMGHMVAVVNTDSLACQYVREKLEAMAFEGSAINTSTVLSPACHICL